MRRAESRRPAPTSAAPAVRSIGSYRSPSVDDLAEPATLSRSGYAWTHLQLACEDLSATRWESCVVCEKSFLSPRVLTVRMFSLRFASCWQCLLLGSLRR